MIKLDKYGAFLHIFPETNPFGWDEFRPILCWGSTLGLAIERWTPQKNRPKRCRPDTWCPGGGSARQKKIRHVGDSWNQMPCHMPYKSTCNQHRHWEFCFLKQHFKATKICDSLRFNRQRNDKHAIDALFTPNFCYRHYYPCNICGSSPAGCPVLSKELPEFGAWSNVASRSKMQLL